MWCERNSPVNPVKKITVYVDNDNMDIKGKKNLLPVLKQAFNPLAK